jgi:hypothetical protein
LVRGWDEERLDVMHHNEPDAVIHAFGFEEAPEVRMYVDPTEFRDAHADRDSLTVHVGEDAEISVELIF